MNSNLGCFLDKLCEKYSERTYINFVNEGSTYSYGKFHQCVNNFAKLLIKLNLKKGDSIALKSFNNPEWIAMQWAAFKLGILVISLHKKSTSKQVKEFMEDTNCNILFTDELNIDILKGSNYSVFNWEDVKIMTDKCKEEVKNEEIYCRQKEVKGYDDAIVLFTSGSVSKGNGVILTHMGIITALMDYSEHVKYKMTDNTLVCTPFSHMMSAIYATLSTAIVGARVTLLESFKTISVAATIARERCTIFFGVPSMYIFLLEKSKEYDLSTLRAGIIAGACVPAKLYKRLYEEINMTELLQSYGQTETLAITATGLNDSMDERCYTTGKPFKNVQIKIIDIKTGEEVEKGKSGEILVKTPYLMKGYFKDESKTQQSIDKEGFFRTGDLGYFDKDGNLCIKGRIKEIIIRGGENICPREIEEVILKNSSIQEVVVIGIPNEYKDEEIAAFIVLKESKSIDVNDLRKELSKELSTYKIPKYIEIISEFPRTKSGKIDKKQLSKLRVIK